MAGKLTSHDIKEFLDLKGIKCGDVASFKNIYRLSYNCTLQIFNESTIDDCEEPHDWAIRTSYGDIITIIDDNEFFHLPMTEEDTHEKR
jgi:hypothetical protein